MDKRDLLGLARQLKSYYETLRSSPLPDRLAILCQQLEKDGNDEPKASRDPVSDPPSADEKQQGEL